MPDLLIDLKSAKDDGRFADELKKYTNPTLLILDEWPLLKLSEDDAPNLLELINKRRKHSSTIFCSQFREEGWYNKLGGLMILSRRLPQNKKREFEYGSIRS